MEKIGIYPGSFNPWHAGHEDILKKALNVFDRVIIAQGINPEKDLPERWVIGQNFRSRVRIDRFSGFLHTFIEEIKSKNKTKAHAVIRGLRNGHDLQYEMNQQYWYEDLGLKIPLVYFVTDRKLSHISSSAIRSIEALKVKGKRTK